MQTLLSINYQKGNIDRPMHIDVLYHTAQVNIQQSFHELTLTTVLI